MNPSFLIPATAGASSTRPGQPVVLIDATPVDGLEVVECTASADPEYREAVLSLDRSLDVFALTGRNQVRSYLNRTVKIGWNMALASGAVEFLEFVTGRVELIDSKSDERSTRLQLRVRSLPPDESDLGTQVSPDVVPVLQSIGPIVELSALGDPASQMRAQRIDAAWTHRNPLECVAHLDYVVEATIDLVKGWDPAGEGRSASEYDRDTSSSFDEVVDVFRHWVLNDDGEFSSEPFLQPEYDAAALFDLPSPPPSPLRFGSMMSHAWTDSVNRVRLEYRMSPAGAFIDYPGQIVLDRDRAGVRIVDSALPEGFADAGNGGTLEVRITATLKAPESIHRSRLSGNPFAGPPDSKEIHFDTLPRLAVVSVQSQFFTDVAAGDLEADEQDDRSVVDQFLLASGDWPTRDSLARTQIAMCPIDPTIMPGSRVNRLSGDRWVLDLTGNARALPTITRVRHRFGAEQHTQIELNAKVRAGS